MTQFAYKAKEGPKKIVSGVIDAQNVDSAINKIIQQGLSPLDVVLVDKGQKEHKNTQSAFPFLSFSKKVKKSQIVLFTRQMSDLVDASVAILRALKIVSDQIQNPHFKEIVLNIRSTVEDGGSFSDALGQYPMVFSNLYVNMVKTGEVSGKLEIVLNRLANYLEKDQETRSKVQSSLAYPALILCVGFLTVFVLLTFVIPRITVMFDDLDQQLPMATTVLINISYFFAHFWWLILAVIVFIGIYFKQKLQTDEGRLWFDSLQLKIPILNSFIKIVEVGRFARTLGTLVESGVPIPMALNSVWPILDNAVLKEEIKHVSNEIRFNSHI